MNAISTNLYRVRNQIIPTTGRCKAILPSRNVTIYASISAVTSSS